MKTPKPLWPLTYVRAARWLDCQPSTVSRFAQGRKVTFDVFRDLIHQGVGNARERWRLTNFSVVWCSSSATIWIGTLGTPTVSEFCSISLHLIREAFYGIEGKQAPLSFAEVAAKFAITKDEAEAAIRFPW